MHRGQERRLSIRRRDFLFASGGSFLAGCAASDDRPESGAAADLDLASVSLAKLRAGLDAGHWTARSLCEAHLKRIEEIDTQGPALRSVIEVNPDALADADRLDDERAEGRLRGPLHGIPVMLKDNISTPGPMQTTAGSLALVDSGAQQDSGVARQLRQAGAVLLAKTNLSEWANFRSTRSTSGWSARGGLTRNPYYLDRNPCGSSSGSAVAVSAGLAPLSVGTETNGSIVCPASVNGIVGVKPTVGLVSRSGIVPISHTQDTAGPMARSVADAATLLGALAGVDPSDPATQAGERPAGAAFLDALDPGALRGARIGLLRDQWQQHAGVDALLEQAVVAMSEAGTELVDLPALPGIEATHGPGWDLMLYEFKDGLNRYLAGLGPEAKVRTLDDVIRFNEQHADQELPHFGQEIFEAAARMGSLSEPAYQEALALSRDTCRNAIDGTAQELDLDAFFAPSTGPAWLTDLERGDQPLMRGCSSPAARAGYPHVTLPGGFADGLPVGVSFFGPAWTEPRLLALAHAFEMRTRHRRPPGLLPGGGPTAS